MTKEEKRKMKIDLYKSFFELALYTYDLSDLKWKIECILIDLGVDDNWFDSV